MGICYTCESNDGSKRISPGIQIFNGNYWLVEHAYPSGLLGWMVVVLKRHCEELHNLTKAEWDEFAAIQFKLLKSLKEELEISKEYVACFAEMEGFKHIHFHIIPKTKDFILENIGTKSFQYLKVEKDKWVDEKKISEFCKSINCKMNC